MPAETPAQPPRQQPLSDYDKGYLDGLRAYAWMKDGVTYVGTCGTTLASVEERFRQQWNYGGAALRAADATPTATTGLHLAERILRLGHNDDCIFCGFKDKLATEAVAAAGGGGGRGPNFSPLGEGDGRIFDDDGPTERDDD